MKLDMNTLTPHDLLSPIASMHAQIELIKRSKDYSQLSDETKATIERLEEKVLLLGDRIKEVINQKEE